MKFKNFEEALNWIHGTIRLGIKPGLKRMELLMEKLEFPERKNIFVHVAGTNGKGSTVTFIRNILEEAGYRVGTFTSPYIESFNERISINGIPISNDHVLALTNEVKPIAEKIAKTPYGHPSEFELVTAMMFLYFAKYEKIDIGIIEAGLGGRLDSTNVLTPVLSIITTIGKDHTDFLGETLEEIAYEKAGIIKAKVPVITGVLQKSPRLKINEVAKNKNASVSHLHIDFNGSKSEKGYLDFSDQKTQLNDLCLGLFGDHQFSNASVAVEAALNLSRRNIVHLDRSAIYNGLRKAFWPARMEKIVGKPAIYLDGAHNPEGIEALKNNLSQLPGSKTVLLSILQDKNHEEMISILKEIPQTTIFLTTFNFPRAMTNSQIKKVSQEQKTDCVNDWSAFLSSKERLTTDYLIVTGSLYFIAEVRKQLKGMGLV